MTVRLRHRAGGAIFVGSEGRYHYRESADWTFSVGGIRGEVCREDKLAGGIDGGFRTSRRGAVDVRVRSNWMGDGRCSRGPLVEVISVTPAMWPELGSGVATEEAMISALAPGGWH